MNDIDLDELRAELDEFAQPEKAGGRSAREQRIIAGFEEIERFVEEHGRLPEHGEGRDIFERLYAVRLDRLRELSECRELLREMDSRGLLDAGAADASALPTDDELLAELGGSRGADNDVTRLEHVRSREQINAAEEVARRAPCKDFGIFKPLFDEVQRDLKSGARQTVKYGGDYAGIKQGDLFILEGQKVLVANVGEEFVSEYDRTNSRLRVIYDNGTESEPLLRSLQRALYEDKTSRRITKPGFGPLFAGIEDEDDLATGYIYVLRSKSEHPFVAENRTIMHKIGVTGGDVKTRIAGAKKDPTYLLADVEIVVTYKLANINPRKLEALLHRFFGGARLDLELKDRFGSQVEPREWFLVPLPAIDEAIEKLKEGTLTVFRFDPATARLVPATESAPAKLKALSLRQPWAEEIMLGEKTEEFRGTPTQHRGPIYIYASLGRVDREEEIDWGREHRIDVDALPRGVIVGTVEIVDCHEEDEGMFVWTLANPQRLATPIPPVEKPQPVWFHPFGKP